MKDLSRLRQTERWIAWVRVGAVPFAVFQVSLGNAYPPGYERAAWSVTGGFLAGTAALLLISRLDLELTPQRKLAGGRKHLEPVSFQEDNS